MSDLVTYDLDGPMARITIDDGKVNVMSFAMICAINDALDRAERDGAVVVLSGRDGVFSAGFDLGVLRAGGYQAAAMVRGGFELAERVLSFPRPVVIACTGHTVAMGVFLLLSGDYRVAASGSYRITANEVAIGLTMPHAALAVLRQRLTPAAFSRAVVLAESFTPDNAVAAGFVDQVVAPSDVRRVADEVAASMLGLDAAAHTATKLRARAHLLAELRSGVAADWAGFRNAS